MRTRILVIACVIIAMASFAAFGADNTLGTWKMNMEKSTYTGGAMPIKSLNLTREATADGVKVTVTGERPDGTPISASYTANYDGKEVPVSGNVPFDIVSVKQINANTINETRKKTGGSYQATNRTVVSNNGMTATGTTKGRSDKGEAFTSIFVFDKQ